MRISDWSSDVCSSDLAAAFAHRLHRHDRADAEHQPEQGQPGAQAAAPELLDGLAPDRGQGGEQAVHGLLASGVSSLAASTSPASSYVASPATVSCLPESSAPAPSTGGAVCRESGGAWV